jgi:hypothetical protein
VVLLDAASARVHQGRMLGAARAPRDATAGKLLAHARDVCFDTSRVDRCGFAPLRTGLHGLQ